MQNAIVYFSVTKSRIISQCDKRILLALRIASPMVCKSSHLAIALELVSQNARDNYQFNNQSIGKEREKIASALATEFTHQELYGELKERIESSGLTQLSQYTGGA